MASVQRATAEERWSGPTLAITSTEADARLLRDALHHQLAADRRHLRVDLSELPFIDAAGLEVILEAHWALLTLAGTLVLPGMCTRTGGLVQIIGLDSVLLIAAGVADPRPEITPSSGLASWRELAHARAT